MLLWPTFEFGGGASGVGGAADIGAPFLLLTAAAGDGAVLLEAPTGKAADLDDGGSRGIMAEKRGGRARV